MRQVPGWEELSEKDLAQAVDDHFLHEDNQHCDFIKKGMWVCKRHPLNQRGDEAVPLLGGALGSCPQSGI